MKTPKELELDCDKAIDYAVGWVRGYFKRHGMVTGVVGISGGSDSALAAYLVAKAIGGKSIIGVIMPEDGVTPLEDLEDAEELVKSFGLRRVFINITDVIGKFLEKDRDLLEPENRTALANIKARVRMTLLYKEANKNNGIVIGTGDRSESILGYFTKYGDGGVDISVIKFLYKTQVRRLLEYISGKENIPVMGRIAEKKPSPRLWKGHTAEDELAADYETIDRVLFYMNDSKERLDDAQIAKKADTDSKMVSDIRKREEVNRHKGVMPPSPRPNHDLYANLQ